MNEIHAQTNPIANSIDSVPFENDEVINEILQNQLDDKDIIDNIQDKQMKYDMGKKISQFGRNLYREILSLLRLREREKKQFVKNAKSIYNILVDIKNSVVNNKCSHVKINIDYKCDDTSHNNLFQPNENDKINSDAVKFSIELFRKHSENNGYEISICHDNEENKNKDNKLNLTSYYKPFVFSGLLFLVTTHGFLMYNIFGYNSRY